MKLTQKIHLLLLSPTLMASPLVTAATIITHEGLTENNLTLPGFNSALGYATYGSNVTAATSNWSVSSGATGIMGTPDISLRWNGETGGNAGAGFDTYGNWDGRTASIQLDSGTRTLGPGTPNFFISFVPSLTSAVLINSFALDAWAGGTGSHRVEWSVTDTTGATVLTNGVWTKSTAGGRDTINVNYAGTVGQTLVLKLFVAQTIPTNDSLAMDNLSFDQVPEPASSALIALGGLGCVYRRRR